jgi:hypothetical protein
MKKLLLLITCILLLSNSVFSFDRIDIDECNYLYIDEENFLNWAENKTLEDINGDILEYMILEKNLTERVEFFINFNDEEIKIYYENEYRNGEPSTVLGEYKRSTLTIHIYVKNILYVLEGKGFATNENAKLQSYNTLIHEITHYFDLDFGTQVFTNRSQIFFPLQDYDNRSNMSQQTRDWLYTIGTFITYSPAVPLVLQDSVDFQYNWRFNYVDNRLVDEMIARAVAVCLSYENYNTATFDTISTPAYCEQYFLEYVNISYYNYISEVMMKTFYLENYPQENELIKSTKGLCLVQDNTFGFFNILNVLTDGLVKLATGNLLIITLIGVIFVAIVGISNIIIIRIKNSINIKK